MQLEALWTISAASKNDTSAGHGSGVVIFETNRIFGGDGSFYYIGNFTCENGKLEANLRITRHSPGDSIFGPGDEFDLKLSGEYKEGASDFIVKGMQLVNDEPFSLAVNLTYREELP